MAHTAPVNILVVDDDPVARHVLRKVVEAEGHRCIEAEDGERALQYLERTRVDILVTDKNLPGINGLELARVARNLKSQMPVVMVTAFGSEESAAEAAEVGVETYLRKPIAVDQMRPALRNAVKSAAVTEESNGRERIGPDVEVESQSSVREDETQKVSVGPEPGSKADPAKNEKSLSVVIVEPDSDTRLRLLEAIAELGHRVAAFPDENKADAYLHRFEIDVLIARPETLRDRDSWVKGADADARLGAIAIMDDGGLDRAIEAIYLGARGTVAPPFSKNEVAADFSQAVDEMRSSSKKR
ncbi:MAG: response regulator [Polyangia bacterium]